jgi:hypothetical protein
MDPFFAAIAKRRMERGGAASSSLVGGDSASGRSQGEDDAADAFPNANERVRGPVLRGLVTGTRAQGVDEFNGAVKMELPPINQFMCGSCWAIAASMALKANLRLKDHGFRPEEVPNLSTLIACSDKPHQIVNTQNDLEKWIIELSSSRVVGAGCEGGITGMALAMLQVEGRVYRDSTHDYLSGYGGDLTAGPVRNHTLINLPQRTCPDARLRAEGLRVPLSEVDLSTLDTAHLFRRKMQYGVAFPSTRDVREFIIEHGAVIAYVDMDSGLDRTDLYGKDQVHLSTCKWSRGDYTQSGGEDGNAISLFKEADHAVLLVGWSCTRKAWLVKNSWGTDWGVDGLIWLEDANVCANEFETSAHSYGAGPACMFGSTLSVFTL